MSCNRDMNMGCERESTYKCVGKMEEFPQIKMKVELKNALKEKKVNGNGILVRRNFCRKLGNGNYYRLRHIIMKHSNITFIIILYILYYNFFSFLFFSFYKWRNLTSERLRKFPHLKQLILKLDGNSGFFWPQSSCFISSLFVIEISRRKERNTQFRVIFEVSWRSSKWVWSVFGSQLRAL